MKYATEKPWQRAARREGNNAAAERYRLAAHGRAREVKQRYIARNRAIIQTAKSRPCHDCGIQYPYYVMQFDHLGDKHFNIGNIGPTASRDRLLAEIAKCDVVCANCHFERTYQRSRL